MSNDFSIEAHHYQSGKIYLPDCIISRKYNGWNVIYDGGLTEGIEVRNIPWVNKTAVSNRKLLYHRSRGLWTMGRSSGPRPLFPPEWWMKSLKQSFSKLPVQGELWHPTDETSIIKSVAGQKPENSIMDFRWNELFFIPNNIKPYHFWPEWEDLFYKQEWYQQEVNFGAIHDSPLHEKLKLINSRSTHMIEQAAASGSRIYTMLMPTYQAKNDRQLADISSMVGGEGLMIAHKNMTYSLTRSHHLLKLKNVYETEGTIIGHDEGEGKYVGKLGSIRVAFVWDDKVFSVYGGSPEMVGQYVRFSVSGGILDEERNMDNIPEKYAIGKTIHFKYRGVTHNGVPVSATIIP